ncbi:unnamed protein product [Didymodactylos carnosus]|uniref:Uncharacterized protein n=1 Tax=Didymodactylos carnosus TaxID=1234261 RepID=A0A814I5V4_9BILA|nr:unnamed protein product [Didymodactylos carnosus]CAF1027169.1 unnamed protein product [Didymodactylos carnosus]CAF3792325.1 unnamed protein product [Didymodactylos carnosus]CAF3795580.1 unnamed protein product [Didymodactylos carnosus]
MEVTSTPTFTVNGVHSKQQHLCRVLWFINVEIIGSEKEKSPYTNSSFALIACQVVLIEVSAPVGIVD